MRSVYDLFEQLAKEPKYLLSGETLDSVRDYFHGYTDGLAEANIDIQEGDPPFSQFASWLARRYGKSQKSLYGRWTRYNGGWWRIIEEQFGAGKSGFKAFFDLVTEFRERKRILIAKTAISPDATRLDADNLTQLEAVEYVPNDGYYLDFIYVDGRMKVEGFYSTLEDLLASAAEQYEISPDCWELFTKEDGGTSAV